MIIRLSVNRKDKGTFVIYIYRKETQTDHFLHYDSNSHSAQNAEFPTRRILAHTPHNFAKQNKY